ncbi:MAG TPA: ATP-binding protein [Acidimicrobiia bacterium]|nr:ATP-binding protein [Acidimicrobiia bacterium]
MTKPVTKQPARPRKSPATRSPAEIKALEARLREAEDTLNAIRSGDVDALVVQGPSGDRVFTLRGSDHRYRQLVETMTEGALLLAPDGTLVYANERFAQLVGVPHETLLGTSFEAYVASSSRAMVDALLRGRDTVSAKAEVEIVTADGTLVPVYLSATASWDENNQITCVIATDLSEQKRHQEMVVAERLTTEIVEHAAEGIVVCDLSGKVIRASRAALRLTDDNPLLLPFERAFSLDTADAPDAGRAILDLALTGVTTSGREVALRRRDRDPVVLLLSAAPVPGSDGQPIGAVISFVDITEAKRATEERARLLERATEARVEAEAANRAKDEFLAMLGHELRNPLAPILTAIELMKAHPDDSSTREREVIERQVTHLVMLVNDLLDVSRIAQGKVELHKRPIELADVIASSLEACSPILEERRHELTLDVEPGLIVDGDEARLAQVISNLVTNAAKYTERCGRVSIVAKRDGDDAVVLVRDNGMGIAPDLLATLFDRFVQSKRTLDRSEGGLGLGLSIVRSLVTLHGGTVAARSSGIGRGSELEVRLPVCDTSSLQPAAAAVAASPAHQAAAGARRVLIVDDNTDAAEMLADALSVMGHETRVAFDGPSGLDAAAGFVPDIAFLDIGLPAMDGYELARKMRTELAFPQLRLVALTGYGQDSDRQRSVDAGFDGHMVKPINLAAVASTIERLTRA